MKKYFENDEILGVLWRWKKPLIIVFCISFLGSAIFSSEWFIQPKFKSFAKVYPTNLKKYSEESPTEQMIQMLESDEIREEICKRFNLGEMYKIEPDDPHFKNLLYEEYADHVHFKKTKFESVEIEVLSTDPEVAYEMVNAIIDLYNIEVKRLQDEKLVEAVNALKDIIDQKVEERDKLEARVNVLRKEYGILDYNSQVRNLSKEYYKLLARSNVNPNRVQKVREELENLKQKGVEYEHVSNRLWTIRSEYNAVKTKYDEHLKELNRKKEYTVNIVKPYKADKKTYPVRWLIVVVSVAVSLIGALGVISFIDRFEKKNIA